jgi:hypothetical protein
MLDSLNPGIRHLILAVVPVILGVLSTDFVPQLQSVNPFVATVAAALVQQALLYFSTLTTQYGVGSRGEGDAGA